MNFLCHVMTSPTLLAWGWARAATLGAALAWSPLCQGQIAPTELYRYEIHERTVSFEHKDYVVTYRVCVAGCTISVPATYPPGQSHYQADISVYEQRGLQRVQIASTWAGQWTPNGCSEDDPKTLLVMALKGQK